MVYVDSDNSDYTDKENQEDCPDCGEAFVDLKSVKQTGENSSKLIYNRIFIYGICVF